MLRQRLDFARPQPAVSMSGRLLGLLVLAASLALAALLAARYQSLGREIESVETRMGQLSRAGNGAQMRLASREAIVQEVRRVNQAAARLTIPWEDLFATIESATDKQVALLALQPNFQKRELKITGEAEDFDAIRRYMERLEEGETLAEARLLSHELVSRPNANLIRFELTATWGRGA